MREAEVGLVALFLVDVVGGVVDLGLVPARAAIDGGALGKRVFVLEGDAVVLAVGVFLGVLDRGVDVVEAGREVAARDRDDRADVSAEALDAFTVNRMSFEGVGSNGFSARPLKYWPITKTLATSKS